MASKHTPDGMVIPAAKRLAELDGHEWDERATGAAHLKQNAYMREARAALDASAAPDLLAACERMMADLREQRDTGLCSRFRDEQIADLRAVVAKATGQEG